ncbi:MAG: hypothetical protein M3P51_11600 [Chloroflexota bacterium]|nr:hypothetical protein [Chloroflexota bacterium]
MSTRELVREAGIFLEQMAEEPQMVMEALEPAERTDVVVTLQQIVDQADEVRTEAELLDFANSIYTLVEEVPGLRGMLLPEEMDVREARAQRGLDIDEFLSSDVTDALHVAECRDGIVNRARDAIRALDQLLPRSNRSSNERSGDDDR